MIHRFSFHATTVEPDVEHLRRILRVPDLEMWLDYYIEFDESLSEDEIALLGDAMSDPVGVEVRVDEPFEANTVSIVHRRGIVDNESVSIVVFCEQFGMPARAGKVARNYRSISPELRQIVEERFFNSSVEELHESGLALDTLVPAGVFLPAERYDLRPLSDDELTALGHLGGRSLSLGEMRRIREIQEALEAPFITDVLLEALDARWSDHCAHTTWKSLGGLLDRLVTAAEETRNPNIVSMFHDNAGVWDFYDGYSLALKAETHNGPSAVSAYFGQLTKLGGVLRDILGTGLGADPIGSFEYTATGLPEASPPTVGRPGARQIAHETIQGIKEYGNTFGVPMMSSRMTFHPSYRAKPFALGGSVGILPKDSAQRGIPQPGDLVVLIGGRTGNEGVHGASASSARSQMDVSSVQIGAPLEQVKFRKALMDLRDAGLVRALTDVGAAGLNSAVGEIGDPGGIWINTALVPLKTLALPMWMILLSESQERMLLAIPPDAEVPAREILDRHQVRTTVIGRFTATGRYCVFHQPALDQQAIIALGASEAPSDMGEFGFDVPYDLLGIPTGTQEVGPLPNLDGEPGAWSGGKPEDLQSILELVIADAEVASQLFADSQYDSTVQGNTVYGPQRGLSQPVRSGYWAGTPVDGSQAAAVLSTAFNPWLFEVNPVLALRQQFIGLLAGQILAGVELADICLCDNFYTPHLSEYWREWLVGMVDELAALVRRFRTPVISGKDSSAGSTYTDEGLVSVPPAVFLTALGKVPNHRNLLTETWTSPSSMLVRLGPVTSSSTGTAAARVLNLEPAALDEVSVESAEGYLAELAASRSVFRSGVLLGPGGLGAELVKGVLASGLGVELTSSLSTAEDLFAEHRCGVLVEIDPSDVDGLPSVLQPVVIGRLTSDVGVKLGDVNLLTPEVRHLWATAFAERLT